MASNVPRTRRKLEEAKHFLGRMELLTFPRTQDPQDWDVFDYNLSAFLSAAASVQEVLRHENKKLCQRVEPVWKKALAQEDRALVDSMYARRVDEVHLAGVKVQRDVKPIPMTPLQSHRLGLPPHLVMQQILMASEGGVIEIAALAPRFAAPGGASEDVLSACRRYVDLLEALVRTCEQSSP